MSFLVVVGVFIGLLIIVSIIYGITITSHPRSIEKMKSNKNVKGLIKLLGYRKDHEVRESIISSLVEMRGLAIDPLIDALIDDDRNVRVDAAEALGKIADFKAVEPLIALLKDEDKYVRVDAAGALGRIGDERAVKPLIDTLIYSDSEVRHAVIKALGSFESKIIKLIVAVMNDENSDVREAAAEILKNIDDPNASEALLKIKTDSMNMKKNATNKAIKDFKSGETVIIKSYTQTLDYIFDTVLDFLPVLTEAQFKKSYEREFIDSGYPDPYEFIGTRELVKKAMLKNGKTLSLISECEEFCVIYCSSSKGFVNEEHISLLGNHPKMLYILSRIYNTKKGIRAVGMLSKTY